MVMQSERENAGEVAVTVEEAIAAALVGIRAKTAQLLKPGDPGYMDDYYRDWVRELLDQGEVVMISIVQPRQVSTWIMQPDHDGVLDACTVTRSDGHTSTRVDFGSRTYLSQEVMDRISWLSAEASGRHLEGD